MFTLIFDGSVARQRVLRPLFPKDTPPSKSLLMVNLGHDPIGEGYIQVVRRVASRLGVRIQETEVQSKGSFSSLKKKTVRIINETEADGLAINISAGLITGSEREELVSLVPPELDADYLSARFMSDTKHQPSVVRAVISALEAGAHHTGFQKRSEPIVIVLGSKGFWGRRVAAILPAVGWKQVIGLDQLEKKEKALCRQAEVIISCVGQAGLVTGRIVSPGAVLIDVGYSQVRGETFGDVDFESVDGKAAFVTPVPGGVGPLAVAYLFDNFLRSRRHDATGRNEANENEV